MDIHDLAGAYAIGALDDDERRDFETHLSDCARCRADVRAYSSMTEDLLEEGDDAAVAPPAGLAERIGAAVAVTAQEGAPVAATGADVTSLDAARDRRRSRLPRLLAAAAALVLVAAVGVGVLLQGGGGGSLASDFDRIRLAADREDLALGLGEGAVWVSRAVGGEEADGVAIDGTLPALPEGQAYQVWTVPADGSAPIPGPVLRPTPDGTYAAAWITPLDGTAAIAVSVEPWDPAEPERGSTTPTAVVAAVELA